MVSKQKDWDKGDWIQAGIIIFVLFIGWCLYMTITRPDSGQSSYDNVECDSVYYTYSVEWEQCYYKEPQLSREEQEQYLREYLGE